MSEETFTLTGTFEGVTTKQVFVCPYADLLPRLGAEARAELRDDIQKRGVVVPVTILYDRVRGCMVVLDGFHRVSIAAELGLPYIPVRQPDFELSLRDEKERRQLALDLNVKRRQLTQEERRAVVIRLAQEQKSVRQIAETLGVPKSTIHRDLSTVPLGTVDRPATVIGADGKERQAQRPQASPAQRLSISSEAERHDRAASMYDQAEARVEVRGSGTFPAQDGEPALPVAAAPSPLAEPSHEEATQEAPVSSATSPSIEVEKQEVPSPVAEQSDDADKAPRYVHWNTPPEIATLLEMLGGIDLDPCSNEHSQLKAAKTFTAADDGLAQDWAAQIRGPYGLIFVNPPYGTAGAWARKCAEVAKEHPGLDIILLVPARTGAAWFHDWVLSQAEAVCWWRGRIQFWREGEPFEGSANFDPIFAHWGPSSVEFEEVFGRNLKSELNQIHRRDEDRAEECDDPADTDERRADIIARLEALRDLGDLAEWTLAKGGNSINLGGLAGGKLRTESGLTPEQRAAIYNLIVNAPADLEYLLSGRRNSFTPATNK
jgi:phage N-6-adenine-methyltransferase